MAVFPSNHPSNPICRIDRREAWSADATIHRLPFDSLTSIGASSSDDLKNRNVTYYSSEALLHHVEKGNAVALKILLLTGYRIFNDTDFYLKLKNKALIGNFASKALCNLALRMISSHQSIDHTILFKAVSIGVKNNDLPVVKTLLKGRTIRIEHLSATVKSAASDGHLKMVKLLLSQGRTIGKHHLCWAALEAAKKRHHEIFSFLLKVTPSDAEIPISFDDVLVEAVAHACENNRIDLVQFVLLQQNKISQWALKRAVIEAAKNGHRKIFVFLLTVKAFDTGRTVKLREVLGEAVESASYYGHFEFVQFLLSNERRVNERRLRMSAINAALNGHYEILGFLLGVIASDTRSSVDLEDIRHQLILEVVRRGHVECLDILLRLGPIERGYRDSALTQVCRATPFLEAEERQERAGSIMDLLNMALTYEHLVMSSNELISLKDIKENPLKTLIFFASKSKLPNAFSLKESPNSIDLGGISKEIYFTLFKSINFQGIFSITEERLPFIPENQPSQQELFKILGKFFSLFVLRNEKREKPFCIGPVFSPYFYKLLKFKLENSNGFERDAINLLKEIKSVHTPCFNYISEPNDETLKDVQILMKTTGVDDLDPAQFAQEIFQAYLLPVESFLSGASSLLQDKIKNTEPERLCLKIQGKPLTKEGLKNSFVVEPNQPESIHRQVRWIKQLIDHKDDEWIKRFVFAVTGMQVLFEGIKIVFQLTWRDAFELHTCFNTVDMPIIRNSALFLSMLEAVIKDPKYNIA